MTEVSFYHLDRMPLERALPRLLERAMEGGYRVVVRVGNEARVDALDSALWTYDPASFLPHGGPRDGNPELQPIYLTAGNETPNDATMVVLVDGADEAELGRYARCLDLFDGQDDESVARARERWARARDAGCAVTYWQQTPDGRWEKKA